MCCAGVAGSVYPLGWGEETDEGDPEGQGVMRESSRVKGVCLCGYNSRQFAVNQK